MLSGIARCSRPSGKGGGATTNELSPRAGRNTRSQNSVPNSECEQVANSSRLLLFVMISFRYMALRCESFALSGFKAHAVDQVDESCALHPPIILLCGVLCDVQNTTRDQLDVPHQTRRQGLENLKDVLLHRQRTSDLPYDHRYILALNFRRQIFEISKDCARDVMVRSGQLKGNDVMTPGLRPTSCGSR
ncbi:hypothetical protein RRG08_012753 [Elysia crispata]|uniref:Uncharacterized protein n=1 Tax=Elysia crispata TaxID=231223 RepID=A0AAE1AL54_9GAST|nr:hypothetical protein RRG08_012753 [Elysia crispata]